MRPEPGTPGASGLGNFATLNGSYVVNQSKGECPVSNSRKQDECSVEVEKGLKRDMRKDEQREQIIPQAHLPGRIKEQVQLEPRSLEPWPRELSFTPCRCGKQGRRKGGTRRAGPRTGMSRTRERTRLVCWLSTRTLLRLTLKADDAYRSWRRLAAYHRGLIAGTRFVVHAHNGRL